MDSQYQPGLHFGFTYEAHFDRACIDNVTIANGHAADIPAIHLSPLGDVQLSELAHATHCSDHRAPFADRPTNKLDA
jgi:hypothetical protein